MMAHPLIDLSTIYIIVIIGKLINKQTKKNEKG